MDIWYGLLAPARTPDSVIGKLSADLRKVLADPDTQSRLREAGVEAAFMNPQQMAALMKRDVERWRQVANRIKLTLE